MNILPEPVGIVIHHSATRDTDTISFDAIRRFHMGELGWDEIGYDYLIEIVDGGPRLLTGRGLQYEGAHCLGCNDMIGICVVGNYDKKPLKIVDGKLEVLVNLITGLLFTYPKLGIDDIHYHREYADKSCPGEYFISKDTLKNLVQQRVAPLNFVRAG